MIRGVGIDIIEVERVLEKISTSAGFREKVFSQREINYCESCAQKGEHYAARFAAKEAFLKATGQGLMAGHDLHEIEIVNLPSGQPAVVLSGAAEQMALKNSWDKIHVSVSHLRSIATAIVILEQL